MNKKYLRAFTIMLVLASALVGCSHEAPDQTEAFQVATKYLEVEYKVDDYRNVTFPKSVLTKMEELKPLISDYFYEGQTTDKVIDLPLQIAQTAKKNINTEHIQIEILNEKNNFFNYDFFLVFTNDEGTSRKVKVTGTLTMDKVNNEWKVSYDWNHNRDYLAYAAIF